jgi:hypothetical protein
MRRRDLKAIPIIGVLRRIYRLDVGRIATGGGGNKAVRGRMTMSDTVVLECPCCGDDGAESNHEGVFVDGQTLICGPVEIA